MQRLVLVIIIAALLITGTLMVLRQRKSSNELAVTDITNQSVSTESALAVPSQASTTEAQILAAARAFAERYGSTISERPAAHLEASLPFASASLRQSFQRQIAQLKPISSEVVKITSHALSLSVHSRNDQPGRAAVEVQLQRKEEKGETPSRIYNQTLALEMVREHDAWKVASATWKGT